MTKMRFGYYAAAITLSVVPLSGCDAASDKLSRADACADLVQLSLSEMRDAREHLDNPGSIEKSLRDTAEEFQSKAAEIDDPAVRNAAEKYAHKMEKLAAQAAAGKSPDLDSVVKANSKLAKACA